MALGFLGSILGGIQSVMPVIDMVGGIIGQRNANKAINKYNVPTGAEKQVNKIYQALLDPNNGLLNTLSMQEKQAANEAYLSQIREMQLADRRAQALGRAPTFFNPERADESISFLTQRGLPMLNAIAAERAQSRLTGAANGISGLIPTQLARNNIGMQQGVSNAAYQTQLPQQFLDILRGNTARYAPQVGAYNAPMESTYTNSHGWIDWS